MYRLLGIFITVVLSCPGVALALVNINTASLSELDTLPGVGPATAQKIVDTRPFSSTSDIQNVQGIGGPGSKTYDGLIDLITVSRGTSVTSEVEDDDDAAEVTKQISATADKDETAHEPVSGLTLTAPGVGYVGQLLKFDIEPKGGTQSRLVRYSWNFGDGEVSDEKSPTHQYSYPGTYVLVAESYFQKETKIIRKELTILPLDIAIKPLAGGGVELVNNGSHEIDLSGMAISGTADFVFPKHTILLAGKSMVLRAVGGISVSLKDELGKPLIIERPKAPTTAVVAKESSSFAPAPMIRNVKESVATSAADVEPDTIRQTASVADSQVPEARWPYLGLLAVIGFGFVALFGWRPG